MNDIISQRCGDDEDLRESLDFSSKNPKMKRVIGAIKDKLGLTAAYLVPLLGKNELESKKRIIAEHLKDFP